MKLIDLYEASVLGDCYQAAANYVVNKGGGTNLVLVHAEVTGQGEIEGVKHGHAWVEDSNKVIDVSNGRDIRLPKDLYYKLGNVNKNKMFRYSYKEMVDKLLSTENYGPWDLKTRY